MSAEKDTIASIEAFLPTLSIPRPLKLGALTVSHRTYCVVRIRTADGLEGNALALSRDTPVASVVNDLIAPLLIGEPADQISAVWDLVYRGTAFGGRTGVVMRGLSLVDIALWDIKGKRAGMPVWRLLGGHDPRVRCVYVGGYPTGEPAEVIGDRVGDLAAQGHTLLKVARQPNPADLRKLLATANEQFPPGTKAIVDAGWWWRTAADAIEEIATWADAAPLAWVEDPLVPEDIDGYEKLVGSAVAPIGVGDELTDRFVAKDLMLRADVDVVRIDAAAIGGITGAWRISHLADALGTAVSYHVYPETHIQLAAGGAAGGLVETFGPRDNPFDPAASLYSGGPSYEPGFAVAPETPGMGFDVDYDLVRRSL